MANKSNPENVDDNRETNGSRTTTSFITSSAPRSSEEDTSTTSAVQDTTESSKFFLPPWGTVFCIMAFLGVLCVLALRVSLSVAIVAMVNQTAISDDHVVTSNVSDADDQCPRDQELERADGELTWDRHQQGTALAAFYYGQIFTQIPAGWLADRFGGKRLFGGCMLLSSVISLLSPLAARFHLGVFVLLRVISGLGNGLLFPAVHALIARWSAPRRRSFIVSVIFFGSPAGVVVGMLLSGVLCDYGFAGGWPSVFYVFGIIGCVWSFAWFLLCYDSPATHPRMSTAERQYWETVIGTDLAARPPTPWRKLLTSVPVWTLAFAYFANDWCFYTVVSCIPMFMHDVLGFNMTKNGTFSALPFVTSVTMIPTGWFSDWLRSSGRLSTTVVRKIFCVTGFVLTGCMLIVVGYSGCNRALAVTVMFIAIGCMFISLPVVVTNQLDLAPLHAGKIMGFTYTAAIVAQIAAPHVVSALIYHRSTRFEWQIIFFLTAGIYAVGAIVFAIFGSGDLQSWAGARRHA